jgi:antitoxin component YwqK of YwqJK toxin-antitoxin module
MTLLAFIVGSCNLRNTNQALKNNADSSGVKLSKIDSTKVSIVTERYSNGVVKSEVSAKGNKREGITKNYHEDGSLMSEINFVNNQKEGLSRDYYPKKKVRMEIMFKQGIMEGEAKWYYETGEVYRVTPYIKGKAEGIQKLYYKDGKVKAEVPYKSGNAAPGLKEYTMKGELIPIASIVIKAQNNTLKMHLSKDASKVKWFEGDIADWVYFPKALRNIPVDIDGNGSLNYSVQQSKGVKSLYIYAVATTEMGNELVLKKKYDL